MLVRQNGMRREPNVKPILLVLGPSGVGKSYLSKKLEKKGFLYVHIDTGNSHSFKENGFPADWDNDFLKVDFDMLVDVLQNRLSYEDIGAIISFPTVFLFTPEMLDKASQSGASPILLWGSRDHCEKAAQKRIKNKKQNFNAPQYDKLYKPAFLTYASRGYDKFRVEAFQNDGSRFPGEEWLAEIMRTRTSYPYEL